MTFGEAPGATVRMVSRRFEPARGSVVQLELARELVERATDARIEFAFSLLGKAAALDAAAAVAALAAMHARPFTRADLDAIVTALASVKPTPGRLTPVAAGAVTLLDDTYNANPRSVRASLAAAREVADEVGGRLVVVLGDMLELGELSESLHAGVGVDVLGVRPEMFVTVGGQMGLAARVVAARAGEGGASIVVETLTTDDAATVVQSVLRPGDVVLVKGSRGMRMERVVEVLASAAHANRAERAEEPK
jgi:UDP-N-acetylmuramoyl-tripeptide--D-alanyl-D-alanine ligase